MKVLYELFADVRNSTGLEVPSLGIRSSATDALVDTSLIDTLSMEPAHAALGVIVNAVVLDAVTKYEGYTVPVA
jgi:hypothetical protein